MGLFNPKKKLQGATPDISVHLDSHLEEVFHPHDTVSGHVALTTPFPITPQAIEVSFWGLSETWIQTRSKRSDDSIKYTDYRDHAPLFTVTNNLFLNPHELSINETYAFPFNFVWPEVTSSDRSECYKSPNDERWTTLSHPFPPTFSLGSAPDRPNNASVSYGITATLIRPGVGVDKDSDPVFATVPIIFAPPNPNVNNQAPSSVVRYPKRFVLHSSSLTGQEPSTIGFRQRVHDRFSSETPKVDFELGVEVPDVLTSGSEFRVRTTFTTISRSANVVHIPEITFRITEMEFQDLTFCRAPLDSDARRVMTGNHWKAKKTPLPELNSKTPSREDNMYRTNKSPLNLVPDCQTVALEEVDVDVDVEGREKASKQADGCEVWFMGRIPGSTPPSFTSFAISRTYRIKVKVRCEVGEKKFDIEAKSYVRDMWSS